MRNINPLHIGLLLVTILIFTLYKLNSAKEELLESKSDYKEIEKLAVELKNLKKVYSDKRRVKSSILRILNNSTLRAFKIKKDIKKSSIVISAESIDKKGLNILLGKVLNSSYNIKRLKIKKLTPKKASLTLEILW